jgi:endonuclease/exonuclease/phosphatase family metal-dependent hydrolase
MPLRRRYKIPLILFAIVGVIFSYRILAVYQFRSPACTPRKAAPPLAPTQFPKRLLIMTYNIQGHAALLRGNHIEEIAKVINQIKPDIVGINEAHRGTWQARFDDHVAELQRRTGMKGAYGSSYKLWGGEFGNLVLTRGEIVRADVHELPGTGEPRTLLETTIRIDGETIDFYVTHLAAWGKVNAAVRGEQLECIEEYVSTSPHPFVLVGDINAEPEAAEVGKFIDMNMAKLAGDGDEPTHKVMSERIDLIFVTPRWLVGSVRVFDLGPSDHRPVVAELVRP